MSVFSDSTLISEAEMIDEIVRLARIYAGFSHANMGDHQMYEKRRSVRIELLAALDRYDNRHQTRLWG